MVKIGTPLGRFSRVYALAGVLLAVCLGLLLVPAKEATAQTLQEGWSGYAKKTYHNVTDNGTRDEVVTYRLDGSAVDKGTTWWKQSNTWEAQYSSASSSDGCK